LLRFRVDVRFGSEGDIARCLFCRSARVRLVGHVEEDAHVVPAAALRGLQRADDPAGMIKLVADLKVAAAIGNRTGDRLGHHLVSGRGKFQ
jgi:hypothetical protein